MVFLFSAALVQAHPGHDDGHDLTWDFSHLAHHPFATALWVVAVGALVYVVFRMGRTTNVSSSGS
jgi:hypothetical protein